MIRKCRITRNKDSNWVEIVSASGKVSLARSNEIMWKRRAKNWLEEKKYQMNEE